MSDVSGYKIIITLEQKVTVYKQNMNKYKFIGDNDHLLIYIMFHVIKERIWYFQLDIHVLGRSEALDCPGKLQWSPPHVVVVVGPPEVWDSPVVVVAEVTRARAPVSHVSWFHLEVSEDSSMLILTS